MMWFGSGQVRSYYAEVEFIIAIYGCIYRNYWMKQSDSCIILELFHLQFILQKIISSASALFISLIDYWVSVVVSGRNSDRNGNHHKMAETVRYCKAQSPAKSKS